MEFEMKFNNIKVPVEFGCGHPEIQNNCPIGFGDCTRCKYIRISIKSVPAFLKAQDKK